MTKRKHLLIFKANSTIYALSVLMIMLIPILKANTDFSKNNPVPLKNSSQLGFFNQSSTFPIYPTENTHTHHNENKNKAEGEGENETSEKLDKEIEYYIETKLIQTLYSLHYKTNILVQIQSYLRDGFVNKLFKPPSYS